MKDLICAWILTNIDNELILMSLQSLCCINYDNISAFQSTEITVRVYDVYFIMFDNFLLYHEKLHCIGQG